MGLEPMTTSFISIAELILRLVEDSGIEPLTQACKASVFPIRLIPPKFVIDYLSHYTPSIKASSVVPPRRLELPHPKIPEPKSGASTNFAKGALN